VDWHSENDLSRGDDLARSNSQVQSISQDKSSIDPKPSQLKKKIATNSSNKNGNKKKSKKITRLLLSSIVKTIAKSRDRQVSKSTKKENNKFIPPWLTKIFTLMNIPIAIIGVVSIAATIAATINSNNISSLNPPNRAGTIVTETTNKIEEQRETEKLQRDEFIPETLQRKELTPVKTQLEAIVAKYPEIQGSVFFVELDKGLFLNWGGDTSFPAASTIKVPVLLALFQDIDAGKVRLDERLTVKPELIGSGSGSIQYEKPGIEYTILEVATKMIAISDNTATNILIDRLGGAQALNQRFVEWGLQSTVIRNALPDLEGTNTTTAKDLSNILLTIEHGKSVSLKSRDRMLHILKLTTTNTLLPPGLEKGTIISHKTGDIGTILGDTGIVDMLNGDRYVITVMAKRPHNSPKGKFFIQEISKAVYEQLKFSNSPSARSPILQAPQQTQPQMQQPQTQQSLPNANVDDRLRETNRQQ
jgi:beta-lactamase class A